jgi:UDP-N-acetyl-D-glucosamine/UDP-N-acetyl-D-galactosamine dehydrogenase
VSALLISCPKLARLTRQVGLLADCTVGGFAVLIPKDQGVPHTQFATGKGDGSDPGAYQQKLKDSILRHGRKLGIIGLGYVGLPVATAFAKSGVPVVGFDIDRKRIDELRAGHDRTREVELSDLAQPSLSYETDQLKLADCDFFIVTVPTPIDAENRPDLGAMLAASQTVGGVLKRGDIVVFESTVYPGAVEEDCAPVLEKFSGLKAGIDFTVGYSPERINPGDRAHRFENITKVVSAQDIRTLDIVAEVYGSVVTAGIHRAPSIKVAEAAKVIENTQRDLNIAFMNELSSIFHRMGIDTGDVLAAAGTKWNFQNFQPGLVGGHCIGVDPYYLTHRAEKAGYRPEIILAGRRINDAMGERIAAECLLKLATRKCKNPVVTILGMTFKENIPDIRNSKVIDIALALTKAGVEVQVHDPLALAAETSREYGIGLMALDALRPADAVILAVAHQEYVKEGWPLAKRLLKDGQGTVFDVKSKLDRATKPEGIDLWRL